LNELGVFCGTFNPVHWGHLLVAECARDQFDLSKVLFITSANPPHRHSDLLDGESRHNLVAAAVADNPYFEASRLELDRSGPSYTVETLAYLHQFYGEKVRLNLIIGGDNLNSLAGWHESERIFKLCRLLAAPRMIPGHETESLHADFAPAAADLSMIALPPIGVSSSEIRHRLRDGKSVLYMVPPSVNEILITQAYYRQTSPKQR
jgi:nicotinate-nucleotide adenylyltransferase